MKALGLKSLARSRSRPAALVAGGWQTPLAQTLQGPVHCIMVNAKKTEPLFGGERANTGSLDLSLPRRVDPTAFGLGDLEEDASTAEKPTGPLFHVVGDGGTPQLQLGEGDVHSSEGRLGDAQSPLADRLRGGHQVRSC